MERRRSSSEDEDDDSVMAALCLIIPCVVCGKIGAPLGCEIGCQDVHYCSRLCLLNHASQHRKICSILRGGSDSEGDSHGPTTFEQDNNLEEKDDYISTYIRYTCRTGVLEKPPSRLNVNSQENNKTKMEIFREKLKRAEQRLSNKKKQIKEGAKNYAERRKEKKNKKDKETSNDKKNEVLRSIFIKTLLQKVVLHLLCFLKSIGNKKHKRKSLQRDRLSLLNTEPKVVEPENNKSTT